MKSVFKINLDILSETIPASDVSITNISDDILGVQRPGADVPPKNNNGEGECNLSTMQMTENCSAQNGYYTKFKINEEVRIIAIIYFLDMLLRKISLNFRVFQSPFEID